MKTAFIQLITSTVLVLIFLFLNRITEKKISARARYLSGIILAVSFLIPLRLQFIRIEIPQNKLTDLVAAVDYAENTFTVPTEDHPSAPEVPSDEDTPQAPVTVPTNAAEITLSVKAIIAIVYFMGAALTLFYTFFRYCKTVSDVQRLGRKPTEIEASEFFSACHAVGVKHAPRLLIASEYDIVSPIMFGFFRPTILISDALSKDSLPLILGHELTHCKRHDSLFKFFFAVLGSAYWFHPLIMLFIRTMNEVCENACDETFLADKSTEEKRRYCRLLVITAAEKGNRNKILFTAFEGGKTQMKRRVSNLLTPKNKKGAIVLISLVLIIVLLSVLIYVAAEPVKSQKTDISPLTPDHLQLTDYTSQIMKHDGNHTCTKDDLRIHDFEISYVVDFGAYVTFNLICEKNNTLYEQNMEFNQKEMFISNQYETEIFSHSQFSSFFTLTELEKITAALNIPLLAGEDTVITELFFTYEGYASPFSKSSINNKPTLHYILNDDGFLSAEEFDGNEVLPVFLLQINEDFYRIFIDFSSESLAAAN